jgi:hypothetical protein
MGRFQLRLRDLEPGATLIAWKKGFLPATLEDLDERLGACDPNADLLQLVLGRDTLAIDGRLVDEAGRSLAGWDLSLVDGTSVTQHKLPPDFVEDQIGLEVRPIRTRDDGHFRIDGLLPRVYVLHFSDPRSSVNFDSEPIRAGTEAVIVHSPANLIRPFLRGRVVSLGNVPLPSVRVAAVLARRSNRGVTMTTVSSTTTDDEGRFELARVPRTSLFLQVTGEVILPTYRAIEEDQDPTDVTVQASARCFISVECSSGRDVDSFSVLGASNQEELIYAAAQQSTLRAPIRDHTSGLLTIGEGTKTLVFYRADLEVGRLSLNPLAGEVLVVDF